jgi:hypothetical protein
MKGKKVDQEFVSQFIIQCTKKELNTPDLIVEYVKKLIAIIDHKIIDAEKQKIKRGKLLDVISTFEKNNKIADQKAKQLPFFQIKNIALCQFIIRQIKIKPCRLEDFSSNIYSKPDIIFNLKQLLEHQVISKTEGIFVKGEKFEKYLDFVLQEVIE